MSIFDEMWPRRTFDTMREYTELVRMLGEVISRGHVEELSTMLTKKPRADEKLYRDKKSESYTHWSSQTKRVLIGGLSR
jgi:hypothetical protein